MNGVLTLSPFYSPLIKPSMVAILAGNSDSLGAAWFSRHLLLLP